MKLAILREHQAHETRVAASPESVKKLVALGLDVSVERGAGAKAFMTDMQFAQAGARLADTAQAALDGADIIFTVNRPSADYLVFIKPGATLIGMLSPYQDRAGIVAYAARNIDAFAMELMPRITRAQSMDVLSSQSNLAGYRAVLEACYVYSRAMPMMMTPGGTIAPARVMVMGAGVAGLQAIATARRLGAIVSATDVRLAAKEQVESLGGKFVMTDSKAMADAETAGGYAREMSEEFKRKQAVLIAETLAKQDIAICTALIPGRPAPVLITEEMVRSMRPGSVIVDLAAEQGGNCSLSKAGECVDIGGVSIIGYRNMPGRLASDASSLYARNLLNFLSPHIGAQGEMNIDWQDEIIIGTALTRDGKVVHASLQAEVA
ncbi:MAG: Re/Si-specific NAD(P)(+) transhydrogenase subunit alpha [Pseudomonadota bacterium]